MTYDRLLRTTMTHGETITTRCAVVGAGPAGMVVSLLLARAGVPVTLLEAHRDFDRDFRGDMIHPSTLEILDQIGLAEALHTLPHVKMRELQFVSADGIHRMAEFKRLPTAFPYVMVMPQARFLDFLAQQARQFPHFRLQMGATVQQLREVDGRVCGVVCDGPDFRGSVAAPLTIGADGRFSRIRRLAGLAATTQSRPMEVIWLRVPRQPGDPDDQTMLQFAPGLVVVMLGREHDWQLGCIVPPGRFPAVKSEGMSAFARLIAAAVPWLSDRLEALRDGATLNVLKIEADRVTRWHRDGLLVIGDAAHVMLPVGGVGINCAVADAVEAANVLIGPLTDGRVMERHLAAVQRRRELLTSMVQRFQRVQHRVLSRALSSTGPVRLPLLLRTILSIPIIRDVPARVMGFGVRRVRVETGEE